MTEEKNEQALIQDNSNVLEAQALTELKRRNDALAAQNADLAEAKRKYYDAIINGGSIEEAAPTERTVNEVRKELVESMEGISNLHYAELVVELDEACRREQGQSCFIPKGKDVTVTADEVMLSEKFPAILKECIEAAEGNDDVFNSELKRHMKKK